MAPFYHPVIGGVEEVVKRVAEYMASRGNEVYVVTYDRLRVSGEGSLPREETINDVHVIRLKPNVVWSHGTYSTELPEALRKLKPDVVHVHVWRHPHVFQVAKLKRLLNFKTVLHMHGPFQTYQQLGVITWLYHRFADLFPYTRKMLVSYDRIITLTPFEKNLVINMLKAPAEKVLIIPNFLDEDFFQKVNQLIISKHKRIYKFEEPIALYLGRVSRDRNIELLLKAAKNLHRKAPKLKVLVVGPAEDNVAKTFRKVQNVKYEGPVYDLEKKAYVYAMSDIFINPTLYESFGVALLEAEAFGLPCIITGAGGQLYTAPPGLSSLWAEPTPKAFAEAVIKVVYDNELYCRLSRGARIWAKLHLANKIIPLYEKLYRELATN